MPVHFQSITRDDQDPELISAIVSETMKDARSFFVSEDRYLHVQADIKDDITGDVFGKVVFTEKIHESGESLEIKDIDIVLNNENRTKLRFLDIREGSSDANEYYDAAEAEEEGHLEIETVNRHCVKGELTGTEREVSICAFPFQLSVYEDIDAFNREVGFKDEGPSDDEVPSVKGLSEKFIMPGNTFNGGEGDTYTFLLGTVKGYRDVIWTLGDRKLIFLIVWLDTALGVIPAAMSPEVFDLSSLKEGALIAMDADIKADLYDPDVFKSV